MTKAFQGRSSFNHDIGSWDVSNVTNTSFMFNGATTFNQPIGDWNVSSVTNASWMFDGAHLLTKIFKIGILPTWSIWMECLKVLPLSINQLEVGMLVMLAFEGIVPVCIFIRSFSCRLECVVSHKYGIHA